MEPHAAGGPPPAQRQQPGAQLPVAKDACWLQQWVLFHIDLLRQGITPLESFLRHALEVFVLSRETPLRFDVLPRSGSRPQAVRAR